MTLSPLDPEVGPAPTPSSAMLRPLSRFALDAAMYSAYGALPFGRLRGRQVLALVAGSAALGAAGTFLGLRAHARARAATPEGWMPWTVQARAAAGAGAGAGARAPGGQDHRALLRTAAIAAAAGTIAGAATAVEVAVDRRMEAFFTVRGARRPRLAVGLSQGVGYAALIALAGAAAGARKDPGESGDDD